MRREGVRRAASIAGRAAGTGSRARRRSRRSRRARTTLSSRRARSLAAAMTKPSNLLTATTLSLAILAILVGIYDFSACDASAAELAALRKDFNPITLRRLRQCIHDAKIRPRATFSAIKVVYQYSHAAQHSRPRRSHSCATFEGCIHRSACPLIDGKSFTSTRHRWCRAP